MPKDIGTMQVYAGKSSDNDIRNKERCSMKKNTGDGHAIITCVNVTVM